MRDDISLSLRAALSMLLGDGMAEDDAVAVLIRARDAGLIRQSSMQGPCVMRSDVNRLAKEIAA